jgi:glycosyltransferase involved in cell wall biosynthesis
MKVLMTADVVGGVWQYSLNLSRHLVERGTEILLAIMGGADDRSLSPACLGHLPGIQLHKSDYKLEWMQQPWDDVDRAGTWLLDLAAQFKPDVIHLNGYAHAALPWRAPVVVVAHSCVYSWWSAVHGTAPPENEWDEYKWRASAGLHAADVVIAPSAFMAAALATHYGFPASRTRVIHNFSDAPLYHGLEKQPFYLAAGRTWDKGKNLAMLDAIASCLPWPMRIAASLPHQDLLEEMQRASVYVHPALYEPFGLAVLEAARAQCCLVLSDIPSLRELWDGAAIFVDPRNPEEWIKVLLRIANDPGERESLGRLAQIHSARYSAATTMEQYRRAYASVTIREGAAA